MAAIAAIEVGTSGPGAFVATPTTLGSDDTFTLSPTKKQILILRNPTGGTLTPNLKGTTATTVAKTGLGNVTVSGGYDVALTTLQVKAIDLSTIKDYLSGVPHITGGTGVLATLLNI